MSAGTADEIGLMYVSLSNLRLPGEAGEVDRIVDWSQSRNRTLAVTGALVFTERRFAQYLEGPASSVDELMASIGRDPRHCEVDVVLRRPLGRRCFETWAMAYAGPSTFVAGHVLSVAEASSASARSKNADRLLELMRQFVNAQMMEQRRNQR